jgi:hypothetical protein
MPDRRFAGALTIPDTADDAADSSMEPAPPRPARPAMLEFAAAILIIGGLTSVISSLATVGRLGDAAGPLDLILVGLASSTIIVGLLVRAGRAWVLDINVVAIILFLELSALPATSAFLFSALDLIVLWALLRHRAWFGRTSAVE